MVRLGKWDKGHDYTYLKTKIVGMLTSLLTLFQAKHERDIARDLVYTAIAYIQLLNGMRAGEAFNAFLRWIAQGQRKFEIEAEKTKVMRPAIIPANLPRSDLQEAVNTSGGISLNAYKKWVRKKLETNTHTLRYAFIRYALSQGFDATRIAKILGHKKVDTTYGYMAKYNAEKDLEKLVES